MPRWRLGVALLIPEPVASELNGLRRALGDGAFERIAPHITLVPPVNVRLDEIDAALALLRSACESFAPFAVELGPVTTFAPVSPVIKLSVSGDDMIKRLRDAVFRPPLERPLTFPFDAHATLADDASQARIDAALVALRDYKVAVEFKRLHLLKEEEGCTWVPIADFPFAEPAVVGRGGLPLSLTTSEIVDPSALAILDNELPPYDFAVTARRDDSVAGVIVGKVRGTDVMILDVRVAPTARGEGVGGHLLKAFASEAADRHATRLVAAHPPCSQRAAFLARNGFDDGIRVL